MEQNEVKIIPTCGRNNCGGRCLLYAHVENGKIVKMTTSAEGISAGSDTEPPLTACVRGLNYHKTFINEDRLTTPLKRTGERGSGEFEAISWEEAMELLTSEWIRIRDTYGPASRYVNYSWGISALMRPNGLVKRLLALDGGYLDYYGSYSTGCTNFTTPYLYGTTHTGNSYSNLLNSSAVILWGHNPQETSFDHMMHFLKMVKKAGIPIYCIDPRNSDTAKALEAEWIAPYPATDAALMDAMAYIIMKEHRFDAEFISRCCMGFTEDTMPEESDKKDCYFAYLRGEKDGVEKTPAWAASITGVPEETILRLARAYAGGKPAALIPGYGLQRHANGEQAVRGAIALACLTGNVGVSGGWAAGTGYGPGHKEPSMPSVENPVKGAISFFTWTDAVDHGHEMTAADGVTGVERLSSDIKMIFNLGGNSLINQHSDINKTAAILKDTSKCEFIVGSDLFMTPSMKYADLILPSVSALEMNNLTSPWNPGNFIACNNQVVEPLSGCRFEYDWLKEVAKRIGLYEEFTEGHETADDWITVCYEALQKEEPELPKLSELQKAGVYRYKNNEIRIAFQAQRENPEKYPFETPSGKVEIYSPRLAALHNPLVPPTPGYVPAKEGIEAARTGVYPLQLIGWHTKRRCHTR